MEATVVTKGEMNEQIDYQTIFSNIESSLLRMAEHNGSGKMLRQDLEWSKAVATTTLSDANYFQILIHIIFYAGFRGETVTNKLPVIDHWFPDYATVARYGTDELSKMLADEGMIKHQGKISACIENARTFETIVQRHQSFQLYVDSFNPRRSWGDLVRLRDNLRSRFQYFGNITVYHFLTDIGMRVLKPDRVVMRIFHRLGLIDGDKPTEVNLLECVHQGVKFSDVTGQPIRYIDLVFVYYGQVRSAAGGCAQGICLEERPQCNVCGVTSYCRYFSRKQPLH
jgi:DNA-3-methyladenine glycosylase I